MRFPSQRLALALIAPLLAGACGGSDTRPEAFPGDGGAAPAVAVREPGFTLGAPDAAITVIEFSDFGCGYCRQFALESYPELHRRYIEPGHVRWRYVPFVTGNFPNGEGAALAAECAAEQGDAFFWAIKDSIYTAQREWRVPGAGDAPFLAMAETIGLERGAFESCLASERPRRRVQAGNRLASMGSVTGTPTFYVEGRRVLGAVPAAQFAALLDALLAERGVTR
jgi:protein-disulfide isomerase